MAAEGEPINLSLPIVWVDVEDKEIAFCNQLLFQAVVENEYVLTLGSVVPPPVIGSHDDQIEQVRQLSYVPARTIARVGLTRKRVEELIEVLQSVLRAQDARSEGDASQNG